MRVDKGIECAVQIDRKEIPDILVAYGQIFFFASLMTLFPDAKEIQVRCQGRGPVLPLVRDQKDVLKVVSQLLVVGPLFPSQGHLLEARSPAFDVQLLQPHLVEGFVEEKAQ